MRQRIATALARTADSPLSIILLSACCWLSALGKPFTNMPAHWLLARPSQAAILGICILLFFLQSLRNQRPSWLAACSIAWATLNILQPKFPLVFDSYYHLQGSLAAAGETHVFVDHYYVEWPGFYALFANILPLMDDPLLFLRAYTLAVSAGYLLLLALLVRSALRDDREAHRYAPLVFLASALCNLWVQLHFSPQSFASLFGIGFLIALTATRDHRKEMSWIASLLLLILLIMHPPTFLVCIGMWLVSHIVWQAMHLERRAGRSPPAAPLLALVLWVMYLLQYAPTTKQMLFSLLSKMLGPHHLFPLRHAMGASASKAGTASVAAGAFIAAVTLIYVVWSVHRTMAARLPAEDLVLFPSSVFLLIALAFLLSAGVNFTDRPLFWMSLLAPVLLVRMLGSARHPDARKVMLVCLLVLCLCGFACQHKDARAYVVDQEMIDAGAAFGYPAAVAPLLFHPHQHFRAIDGRYYVSEAMRQWYLPQEWDQRKRLLADKTVVFKKGDVIVYT